MEVRLFPNSMRPGTGLKPRREAQRPLLPQHARHCPVLEAGSALGFLVYPPLERIESFYVGYQGDGKYQLTYFLNASQSQGAAIFSVALHLPMGSIGIVREQITFMSKEHPVSPETAMALTRTFIVPEDLGTPAGGISLRGATNFQTPSGWDTVYTPVFNMIERPVPPMLIIRVETDWYAHETEFRYVLQPGEGISGSRSMPIGQVVFVPREEIVLGDCDAEEVAAIRRSQSEFLREKAAATLTTSYGLSYSPHYLRLSRSTKQVERGGASVAQVGRNDLCPCGSGKKYKRCHGAT
jgi:hypothetical protein